MMRSFDTSLFNQIYQDIQPIAIVGAGCRFMGASDPFTFWRRVADGEELSRRITADDLERQGLSPSLLDRADFVPVASVVDEAEQFDAEWFGYSPSEAATIDPQQRLFLTCAWEALEMAGIASTSVGRRIGVFGAARMSTHFLAQRENVLEAGLSRTFQRLIGNDKDYLATRAAYKLGLTGPALTVQTACSSSLVAVHMACEQLRSGECDMALAGGAALTFPMAAGYFHQQGMIFSPDGKCRPFDAAAAGTFIGNGVGVVLLKPLKRALEDGDGILAVIRGSAVNNDGMGKAGFTAPSLAGQRAVIEEAMALSGVTPDEIGYIETHGTATPLGDPIEVRALAEAFGQGSQRQERCSLGALKANTGHLDTAAGIGSLLKAAFALKTGLIPPCLHFETPNPALELETTPFSVPQTLTPWLAEQRIAGVSSFGIGGTNCHVVVESLPHELRPARLENRDDAVLHLSLSARDEGSLRALATTHAEALLDDQFDDLAAYCATLSGHRSAMDFRLELSGADGIDLARQLIAFAEGDEASLSLVRDETSRIWTAASATPAPTPPARPQARAFAPVSILRGERHVEGGSETAGWKSLLASLRVASSKREAEHDWSTLGNEVEATARLHAIYAANAFKQLGLFEGDSWLSLDDVMRLGAIHADYRQLVQRLLRDLVAEGALRQEDGRFGGLTVAPLATAAPILEDMAGRGYRRLTGMADRVGPRLAEMLRRDVDPVSLVFPSAAMDDVEEMYERQRDSVFLNDLASDAVAAFVAGLPADHHLRVMEIGAGTGGTTRSILPVLPAHRTSYTFTDVGPLFLRKAQVKFAAYPFVRYAPYDIDRDPAEQGFEQGGYDLVVAANVLHNGRELTAVLDRARRLLAPGGVLLMREISTPKPLFDFIFGPLVPVLSDVEDRGGELFPSLPRWSTFLQRAGFSAWDAFPFVGQQPAAIGENIILARNPEAKRTAKPAAGAATATQGTGDVAALLAVLGARGGDGFWRYENLRLRPQAADEVVWREDNGTISLIETRQSASLISATRTAWRAGNAPPVIDPEQARYFTGGLAQAIGLLPELAQAAELDADVICGTATTISTGRLVATERPSGGFDLALFDETGWPALWIENLRAAALALSEASLHRWDWQAIPSASETTRIAAVLCPQGASAVAERLGLVAVSGFAIPPSAASGEVCLVDLTEAQASPELYAGLVEVIRAAALRGCSLRLVTANVHAVTPWDGAASGMLAGLRGLVGVAWREYPALSLRWVDVDDAGMDVGLQPLTEAEDITAIRRGRLFAPRLARLDSVSEPAPFQARGLNILTAGLSPLALSTAEWLAGQGASSLWLVARRKPTKAERARIGAIKASGAKIKLWSDVDLADPAAFERVLQAASDDNQPVASIFHFAGHLEDAPIDEIDAGQMARVFAPKVGPAKVIADWLPRLKPGRVVFASSAATVFGPPGQTTHAVANAVLEGLAEQASANRWPVKALAWGYWDDERADRAGLGRKFAEQGMLGMTPQEGIALMAQALSSTGAVLAPMRVDWVLLSEKAAGRLPPALAGLAPAPVAMAAPIVDEATPDNTVDWLRDRLGSLLGVDGNTIDANANLVSLGLDSLMLLELNQALKTQFGLEVSADLSLESDTLAKLANHVAGRLGATPGAGRGDVEMVVRKHVAVLLSLPLEEVRTDRKLVELGLDSLLFLDLSERIAKELDVRISGETAIQFDTVAALAAAVRSQLGEPSLPANPVRAALKSLASQQPDLLLDNGDLAPRPARAAESWPLSPLQQAWWTGRAADQPLGGTARHLYVEYDKDLSVFDLDAFERAWHRFVDRHAALRLSIGADGRARLRDDAPAIGFIRDDCRQLSAEAMEACLAETRERMSHQLFDLAAGPFYEWRVSLLPGGSCRLHFDIDTTLIDIESFQVMLREIGRHIASPQTPLPPLSFSATDYLRGLELIAGTSQAAADRAIRVERGMTLPPAPDLPLSVSPNSLASPRFAIERQALTRAEWLTARDAAAANGVSGTALLLSAFAAAIRPWTGGQQHFALQLAYPDRKPLHAEVMNIACEASAAMAVAFDFEDTPSFLDLMARTEALIREELGFELADGLSGLSRRAGARLREVPNILLPVMFTSLLGVRQSYALPESADPVLGMPSYEYAAQPQVALHFQALEEERELLYNLDTVAGLFPQELGARLLAEFVRLLRASPDLWSRPVSDLIAPAPAHEASLRLGNWLETLNGL